VKVFLLDFHADAHTIESLNGHAELALTYFFHYIYIEGLIYL
jgi:hypothetical protein